MVVSPVNGSQFINVYKNFPCFEHIQKLSASSDQPRENSKNQRPKTKQKLVSAGKTSATKLPYWRKCEVNRCLTQRALATLARLVLSETICGLCQSVILRLSCSSSIEKRGNCFSFPTLTFPGHGLSNPVQRATASSQTKVIWPVASLKTRNIRKESVVRQTS